MRRLHQLAQTAVAEQSEPGFVHQDAPSILPSYVFLLVVLDFDSESSAADSSSPGTKMPSSMSTLLCGSASASLSRSTDSPGPSICPLARSLTWSPSIVYFINPPPARLSLRASVLLASCYLAFRDPGSVPSGHRNELRCPVSQPRRAPARR